MSLENPFVALEQAIIQACAKHEEDNRTLMSYRRFIRFADHYIKFGDSWCFSSEVQTHTYFANITKEDSTAPRVSLIRHTFKHGSFAYAVIEPIETVTVTEDVFIHKVAEAVIWMRNQPPPAGVVLGPLGSGPAWHKVFKNWHAPLPFTSVVAVEKFLNTAVSKMQRHQKDLADISISDERLVLTQSDMHSSNFGVDTAGRVVIFDFGTIGWLPESLANYTLFSYSRIASLVFGDDLGSVRASSNLASLAMAKYVLGTGSNRTLGLDKNGDPVPRYSRREQTEHDKPGQVKSCSVSSSVT